MTRNPELVKVIVEGSARVTEQDRESYLSLVREIVNVSTRREGCLKFSVSEDVIERNLFHLTELWTDQKALDASRFGAENTRMLQKFANLEVRDRSVQIYEVASVGPG